MDAPNDQVTRLLKMLGDAKSARETWDSHYQEISERVIPRHSEFEFSWTRGAKRTEKMFDETAALALSRFASAINSAATPQGQTWQYLTSSDPTLNRNLNVRNYFEEVTRILFLERYSAKARFGNQVHEHYTQIGAFGTSGMMVKGRSGGGISYKTLPLSRTYIMENNEGIVDTAFIEFKFTARQAAQEWGVENLPDEVAKFVKEAPHREFDFVHCIMPSTDYDPLRADFRGMPYKSYYISQAGKAIVSEGGFTTFPMPVSRYETAPSEIYGRSPAMLVLPAIKSLNEMSKSMIRSAHLMTNPPLLIHDDIVSSPVSLKPNALNYGGVSADGRQMIQPLNTGARLDAGEAMMEQKRKVINDAFLVTLFQILVESHTMSATEAIERAREKGALLAPTMSRFQNEFLGPMTERELDILARQGRLPEMPQELVEAEGEYEIVYDSPLSRAQRAEEATGYNRTIESLIPLAQINPKVFDIFDTDEVARTLAELHGMPARMLKPREVVEEEMAAQQQQAQAQQLLEAAPVIADTQKSMAEAQQIAQAGASSV